MVFCEAMTAARCEAALTLCFRFCLHGDERGNSLNMSQSAMDFTEKDYLTKRANMRRLYKIDHKGFRDLHELENLKS